MYPVIIGIAAFVAIYGGALLGIAMAHRLPRHHLRPDTRNAISVSMAVLGTLAALVLSLLLTEASTSFSARADAVAGLAASIQRLDRALTSYGPDTASAHAELGRYATLKARELSAPPAAWSSRTSLDVLDDLTRKVMALNATDELHRLIRDQAVHIAATIADERWLLAEKSTAAMPLPFMMLLISWLALLFTSFGIFAPRNPTMLVSLLFCALAIAGGIYMIVEMANPTRGFLRTPTESLDKVAAAMRFNG